MSFPLLGLISILFTFQSKMLVSVENSSCPVVLQQDDPWDYPTQNISSAPSIVRSELSNRFIERHSFRGLFLDEQEIQLTEETQIHGDCFFGHAWTAV